MMNKPHSEQTYHHGDLRQALMDAALLMLQHSGSSAISLRKLAQSVQVSHTACYRHFANKQALLEALAQAGFERFIVYMQAAAILSEHAMDQLHAIGRAYIAFAMENPAYYRLMFNPEELGEHAQQNAALNKVRKQAFSLLENHLERCQQAQFIRSASTSQLAFYLWSTLHGACGILDIYDQDQSSARANDRTLTHEEIIDGLLQEIYLGLKP